MKKMMMGTLAALLLATAATAAAEVKPADLEELAKPMMELRYERSSLAHRISQEEEVVLTELQPVVYSGTYQAPAAFE